MFKITLLLLLVSVLSVHLREANPWQAEGKHSTDCYVEGLSFLNDTHILQSCGGYGGTSYFHILHYDRKTHQMSETYRSESFPKKIFGEGSLLFPPKNIIYMMTYQESIVFRFNATDLQEIEPRLIWPFGEGWSLTHNHTHMFAVNGSHLLFVLDGDFNVLEMRPILNEQGEFMERINELQWVHESDGDFIYSNVFPTNEVIKIDLKKDRVVKRFNQEALKKDADTKFRNSEVTNGIAYDRVDDRFILTGKNWPSFYVVALDHQK